MTAWGGERREEVGRWTHYYKKKKELTWRETGSEWKREFSSQKVLTSSPFLFFSNHWDKGKENLCANCMTFSWLWYNLSWSHFCDVTIFQVASLLSWNKRLEQWGRKMLLEWYYMLYSNLQKQERYHCGSFILDVRPKLLLWKSITDLPMVVEQILSSITWDLLILT